MQHIVRAVRVIENPVQLVTIFFYFFLLAMKEPPPGQLINKPYYLYS